jgi:HTH-type transcriptional regulator/antitoxin HigA
MTLKLIKNEKEYDNALSRVDALMELNSKPGSKESDELEVLVMLVERYEEENWAISEPES